MVLTPVPLVVHLQFFPGMVLTPVHPQLFPGKALTPIPLVVHLQVFPGMVLTLVPLVIHLQVFPDMVLKRDVNAASFGGIQPAIYCQGKAFRRSRYQNKTDIWQARS